MIVWICFVVVDNRQHRNDGMDSFKREYKITVAKTQEKSLEESEAVLYILAFDIIQCNKRTKREPSQFGSGREHS